MPDSNLTAADTALAHGARAVVPGVVTAIPKRARYTEAAEAEADLAKLRGIQTGLEAFDQQLLHHGLSDAADGFEAPVNLDEARRSLDEVRAFIVAAVKSQEEAVAWVQEREIEDRGTNREGWPK